MLKLRLQGQSSDFRAPALLSTPSAPPPPSGARPAPSNSPKGPNTSPVPSQHRQGLLGSAELSRVLARPSPATKAALIPPLAVTSSHLLDSKEGRTCGVGAVPGLPVSPEIPHSIHSWFPFLKNGCHMGPGQGVAHIQYISIDMRALSLGPGKARAAERLDLALPLSNGSKECGTWKLTMTTH